MSRNKRMKIRRSKYRLYKKRKTTARKVGETVLLIALIGGLGFLGYCVADPIIDYFMNKKEESPTVTQWAPDETTLEPDVSSGDVTDDSSVTEETTVDVKSEPLAYYLPDSALESIPALSSAVSTAKSAGYTAVYITLKDEDGYIRYVSAVNEIKDTDLITGTMPLAQIVSIVSGMDMTPVAVLNTLKDNMSSAYVEDTAYRFADDSYIWLDARPELGGKRWVDPFRERTTEYFSALTAEITKAGFKTIVIKNTVFPAFLPYDETVLSPHFFTEDRYKALSSVAAEIEKTAANNSARILIEVDLKDVVAVSNTAELLRDKDTLSGITVVVVFTDEDFDDDIVDGGKNLNISSDSAEYISALYKPVDAALSGYKVVPCIDSVGLSSTTVEKMKTALQGMGYDEIIVK